ncbi:MAG: hypothetical protein WB566_17070 [Terriglobales bacterium]
MADEILFHYETTMVRLRLAPGEAMPWHRDPFQRVAVVLGSDLLCIVYRDGGESHRVERPSRTCWGGSDNPDETWRANQGNGVTIRW